jgi:hypothetical protein
MTDEQTTPDADEGMTPMPPLESDEGLLDEPEDEEEGEEGDDEGDGG